MGWADWALWGIVPAAHKKSGLSLDVEEVMVCAISLWANVSRPLRQKGRTLPMAVIDNSHRSACIAFLCSLFSSSLGLWSHFAKTWVSLQPTTYKNKSSKYFVIFLLLSCEEVFHAPTVQIWVQNSNILPQNNLLIVCHSSIMSWSHNTCKELNVNHPCNYRIWKKIICDRVICDQFVMEEYQSIRRLFGGNMMEFWTQIWTVGVWRTFS